MTDSGGWDNRSENLRYNDEKIQMLYDSCYKICLKNVKLNPEIHQCEQNTKSMRFSPNYLLQMLQDVSQCLEQYQFGTRRD